MNNKNLLNNRKINKNYMNKKSQVCNNNINKKKMNHLDFFLVL